MLVALPRDEALRRARHLSSGGISRRWRGTTPGAAGGAAVAPADRHDLAAERLGVRDLDPAQQAGVELVGDRRRGEERDAEALLDHLLRRVDVVELHHARGLHARACGRARSSARGSSTCGRRGSAARAAISSIRMRPRRAKRWPGSATRTSSSS